jgi:hypothetical protein
MKDSPVMMILLALLAVAGTLGGVWLGRYLERDNEALKWRREHALAAYTEALRACAVVMDEADNIYHMEPSAERVAQGKLLFEKVAEMYRLSDRVTLLGPREIHATVDALTHYYGTEIAARAQKAPKPSDDEWKAIRMAAAPLYMNFLMQARNDLGIHEPLYRIEELEKRLSKE